MTEIPFIAIGNDELDQKTVLHAGDYIHCDKCGKAHQLEAAKDAKTGMLTEILLFYKCGKNAYLAAVENHPLPEIRPMWVVGE